MLAMEVPTIIGLLALICGVTAVSQKSDIRLRLLLAVTAFIWAYHFWLLNSNTTCVMSAFIGIRQLISSWLLCGKTTKTKYIYTGIFEFILVLSTIYTWVGSISLIPFAATAIATYGYINITGYKLRKVMYLVGVIWIINDIIILSWTHALSTMLQLAVNYRVATKLKTEELFGLGLEVSLANTDTQPQLASSNQS